MCVDNGDVICPNKLTLVDPRKISSTQRMIRYFGRTSSLIEIDGLSYTRTLAINWLIDNTSTLNTPIPYTSCDRYYMYVALCVSKLI